MQRPARQRDSDPEVDGAESERTCDDCDSAALVTSTDQGELVCADCGLVSEVPNIDRGPEWRAFSHADQEQRSRVGTPTTQTLHDKGLTTQIDWQNKDAAGRSLSAEKQRQLHRLRTWQERIRTKDAGERNLQFALSELDRMASALGVPQSVREAASVLYRRALEADLIRGRSIEGVVTGSLYAACRQAGIPRSLEEVTAVARVDRREIGRAYRYLAAELELELEPVDPKEYVPRFCSELGASERVRTKAEDVIDTTAAQGLLSGKSPTGYAGAAIYVAALLCDAAHTQEEVAAVANVTQVTIRNRYQEQLEEMERH